MFFFKNENTTNPDKRDKVSQMLHEHIRIEGGGMKKLIFLSSAVFIFTFVITASAADLFLNPGEQHQIEDTNVYCLSGDGDGDPIEVVSSVDLECIKTLHNVLRAIQDACKDVVFNCWY